MLKKKNGLLKVKMINNILTLILGIIVVLILAEVIIRKTISLAQHFDLSGTFIGLTVLSIGTSIPEIMTHIIGSVDIVQNPGMMNSVSALVIGTNIGSDIFQQNFVLALVGIVGTIVVIRKNLNIEVGVLILASVMVWLFSFGGFISRLEGALLLLAYAAYLIILKRSKISVEYDGNEKLGTKHVFLTVILILACFIIMAFAAEKVLDASINLVNLLPISASFFGVIILGIASALPELTTSLVAILKKKEEISAGILIGSNITNPLLGIGMGALISGYTVPGVVIWYDLPVKIATAVLIYLFLIRSQDLKKWQSIVLIGLFLVYLFLRQLYFPIDI